jgi:uncharacterized protein (DUF2235 family)
MAKNIIVCLDGTNNQLRAAINTNVVRLFDFVDLSDPATQVGYYDPGVGTFSSPAAWSPPARTLSRYAGLMFGAGLRQNLGEAYSFLVSTYEDGDSIFVFGFSRGAYTARALTGMMDVFGIFRPGSHHLIPYAVSAYAKQEPHREDTTAQKQRQQEYFRSLRIYAKTHGIGRRAHASVNFVGLWDTVKAAGTLARELRWPFTRQLPHAKIVRHAVSIDENRRPFAPYLVNAPNPKHLMVERHQDLAEVWFAGVHSDVGGMFAEGSRLSDIALKWIFDEAVAHGLRPRQAAYPQLLRMMQNVDSSGDIHKMSGWWKMLGPGKRTVPESALIHASVQDRLSTNPKYEKRLPKSRTFVDTQWRTRRENFPKKSRQLREPP